MDARVTGVSCGWSRDRGEASLSDVNRSVVVRSSGPTWRRAAAFVVPGYLVAVGYMDPGNWATSLAGGSKFGYALLVVALVSNIMAIVLQSLCARLAIASGRDLAQACRDAYPKPVALVLWFLAEVAIVATDIAEVIGTAIGLNLIFGIPLEIGVIITALDVFLILYLQTLGFRYVEALIIALLGVIAVCFGIQIALANPDWAAVIKGLAPTTEIVTNPEMLYLALGILGATVMPHNLYLHSGIVQTRAYGETLPEKREALRFATLDSTVALMFALLINASILILAAATFHKTGRTDVAELGEAHTLLAPHSSVSQSLRPDPQGGRSGERRRAGGLGCLNGMLDDLGRELMTRIGNRLHGAALPPMLPTRPPCRDNASGTSLLSRFDRAPQHGGAGHRSPAPSVRLAGRPRGGGRKQQARPSLAGWYLGDLSSRA